MTSIAKRVFIVTGSSAGIGKEIARGVGKQGHHVVLAVRDPTKGKKVVSEFVSSGIPADNLDVLIVDFSSQKSIHNFVTEFKSKYDRLDVLVNNAAIAGEPKKRLTTHLKDLLSKSATPDHKSRIVNVASNYAGGLDLNDINFDKRSYDNNSAYRQSKQADRMLSWVLADQLKDSNVTVNACHPGVIETGLLNGLGGSSQRTPSEGAVTPLWLATSSELEGKTGRFWDDKKEKECHFRNANDLKLFWDKLSTLSKF